MRIKHTYMQHAQTTPANLNHNLNPSFILPPIYSPHLQPPSQSPGSFCVDIYISYGFWKKCVCVSVFMCGGEKSTKSEPEQDIQDDELDSNVISEIIHEIYCHAPKEFQYDLVNYIVSQTNHIFLKLWPSHTFSYTYFCIKIAGCLWEKWNVVKWKEENGSKGFFSLAKVLISYQVSSFALPLGQSLPDNYFSDLRIMGFMIARLRTMHSQQRQLYIYTNENDWKRSGGWCSEKNGDKGDSKHWNWKWKGERNSCYLVSP